MPDDETVNDDEVEDGDEGEEDPDEEDSSSNEGDDEGEGEGDDSSASDSSDDTTVGGSGSKGEASANAKPADGAVRPTGQDLINLFAEDPVAQRLMATALENLRSEEAANEKARADAEAFRELIEKEDYAGIGQQLVERHRKEQARSEVAEDVLREQFAPVYTKLFAQPEMQNLTADEKASLNPQKFGSDAEYVTELQNFIANKRYEAKIEAEVERRLTTRRTAAENEAVAAKAKKATVGATPGASGEATLYKSSADKIKAGLRAMIDPDGED